METGFYIIGERPVKGIKMADGGYTLYAFHWETGDFEINYDYLEKIVFGDIDGETRKLDESEFEAYVVKLKKERGIK